MPAGADGTTSNAERLARIEENTKAILAELQRQNACLVDNTQRITALEGVSAGRTHEIRAVNDRVTVLAADIDRLDKKSEGWSIINSIAALIAAIVAGISFTK